MCTDNLNTLKFGKYSKIKCFKYILINIIGNYKGKWQNVKIIKILSHLADSHDESIVRIGCHQSFQGNLSENIYYTLDATSEEETNYCEEVLADLENPDLPSINLPQMQQCIMVGSEDIGCEGCNIRFYHNGIDRDDIFDPTKDGRVSE